MSNVFVVMHTHMLPDGEEDDKMIGVYATHADAQAAIVRARLRPGFSDCPDGFSIDKYELGKDHWVEGYFTYLPPQEGR